MAAPSSRETIGVRALVGDAYRLLFTRWRAWIIAMTLPALLDVLVRVAFQQAYRPPLFSPRSLTETTDLHFLLHSLALMLTSVITSTLFAVTWHRVSLIGPSARAYLMPQVGPEHLRFAGASLLLIAITVAIFRLGGLIVQSGGTGGLIVLLGLVICATLYLRWSLVFPAAAIGAPCSFAQSWRLTKGAGLTLFWSLLLGVIPIIIGALAAGGVLREILSIAGMPRLWTQLLVEALMSYLLLAIVIGIISAAYRRLAPGTVSREGDAHGT
ncbi:MAG: hypothetical protein AAFY02_07555 [Pseudomonadota bacterium]